MTTTYSEGCRIANRNGHRGSEESRIAAVGCGLTSARIRCETREESPGEDQVSTIPRSDNPGELRFYLQSRYPFNPDIDEEKIKDLATLTFIEQNQIALFLGAPGVGKTHLALAIGLLAVRAGKRVYCTSAKRLGQEILLGKLRNNLDQLFKKILSAHLWIIDDWGVVSMNREVAEEVFDLMDRRKHSSAMILTSNRDVSEWSEVFPDPIIANATVDRIFDRAKNFL